MSDQSSILILTVDDEVLILDLIASALQDGGYSVLEAASGKEALTMLDERIAELGGVVTDVNLGRGQPTGWDVARHARDLRTDIPVVYISGDSAHDWSVHGVPHSTLVQKPFAPADLVVALASLRKID